MAVIFVGIAGIASVSDHMGSPYFGPLREVATAISFLAFRAGGSFEVIHYRMRKVSASESTYQPWFWSEALSIPTLLPTFRVPDKSRQPALAAELVSSPQSLPSLDKAHDLQLAMDVPAFGIKMTSEVADLRFTTDYREVVFESAVDADVVALLTLHNVPSNGNAEPLQIKDASWRLRLANHKARTHFIADTLYAMLGLAGPLTIAIPNMSFELRLNFKIRTPEISKFLQLRQVEFGLMVIGTACGVDFEIPSHISGDEMNSISLAYHAIFMRQFEWRVNEITQPTPATEEMLDWFDSLKSEPNGDYRLMFGPSPFARPILGREISLGQQTIYIDDAVIENREGLRRELAQKDGHIVPIRIRPRGRRGRYVFTDAPQLPAEPWDERIRAFIALEETLDARLADRYHELAASTVANLTPEEIHAVTSRPELEEDAHLVRD